MLNTPKNRPKLCLVGHKIWIVIPSLLLPPWRDWSTNIYVTKYFNYCSLIPFFFEGDYIKNWEGRKSVAETCFSFVMKAFEGVDTSSWPCSQWWEVQQALPKPHVTTQMGQLLPSGQNLLLVCLSPLTCWMWQPNKLAKNDYSQAVRSQCSVLLHQHSDGQQSPARLKQTS